MDILLSNLEYLPIVLLKPDYESINEHSVAELQGQFTTLLLIIVLGIIYGAVILICRNGTIQILLHIMNNLPTIKNAKYSLN